MKTWICFKDEYPKSECGLLIKAQGIPQEFDEYFIEGHIFYGYVFSNSNYIYILKDIYEEIRAGQENTMAWKILKDYDLKNLYWFYDSTFKLSKDEIDSRKDIITTQRKCEICGKLYIKSIKKWGSLELRGPNCDCPAYGNYINLITND